MTKKMIDRKAKSIVWTVLQILPILIYFACCWGGISVASDLYSFTVELLGFDGGLITDAFNEIFGASGIIPIGTDNGFLPLYCAYLVMLSLARIFIGALTFIPNVIGGLLKRWTNADEE